MLSVKVGGVAVNTSALEVGGAICRVGSLIGGSAVGLFA